MLRESLTYLHANNKGVDQPTQSDQRLCKVELINLLCTKCQNFI